MIRFLIPLAGALALAACASQPPAATVAPSPTLSTASTLSASPTANATAPTLDPFQQWLQSTTAADAAAVAQIAALGTPPDTLGPVCASWLASQAAAGTGIKLVEPKGVMSLLESGYIGIGALQGGGISQTFLQGSAKNCGPWFMMLRIRAVGAAAFFAQFGIGK